MTTRQEQKEKRKQDILYAALDLFVTKGYASTKISDIAQKVDMSIGLLFHYFESKEKLYETLVSLGLEGTKFPVAQKCDHAIDFFVNFTEQLLKFMNEQPYTSKIFWLMAEAQRSEGTPEHIRALALQVDTVEQFIPIIEWGQQEGTIREGNPIALSYAFWCSIQGIAENHVFHPDVELPKATWIVDIVRKR